jgi:hypothetical protein
MTVCWDTTKVLLDHGCPACAPLSGRDPLEARPVGHLAPCPRMELGTFPKALLVCFNPLGLRRAMTWTLCSVLTPEHIRLYANPTPGRDAA